MSQQNDNDEQSESLSNTLENITVTCRYYSELKAYQYMLYQFFHSQDTNVSNVTITSVMYLLQTAAESLQKIQVRVFNFNKFILSIDFVFIITVLQQWKLLC